MRNFIMLATVVAIVTPANSQPLDQISVGDLPGSDGRWQVGEVTVAAPAPQVQRWLVEAGQWPERFPDVAWAQVNGVTPDGRSVIHFHSRIVGRTMTIQLRDRPGLISYDGFGKDVTVQGRIYVSATGPATTHVIMQSSADVHGLAGAFASQNMRRTRAFKKLRSDLTALTRLARGYAAARRPGG
jgi:hypothetical protein